MLPTKRYGVFDICFPRFDASAHHFTFEVSIESSIEREISERVKLNVLNSAIKHFLQGVFLLDVLGKGLGTASPEPDSKAQRQAREERLVRVGSTDANVPWQAQHMLKSKDVLQILAR